MAHRDHQALSQESSADEDNKSDSASVESSVELEDEDKVDLSQSINEKLLRKTQRLVIPVFVAIAPLSIGMVLAGFIGGTAGGVISMLAIVTMTWVGAILGMFGTYLWGTLEHLVGFFKDQNVKLLENVHDLKNVNQTIRTQTGHMCKHIAALEKTSKHLDENLKQFEQLKENLTAVCAKRNEFNSVLTDFNAHYDRLVSVISENKKAQIMAIYYEASLDDKEAGLTQKEYDDFLIRLSETTQRIFVKQGTFDEISKGDGLIDLKDFEEVLQKVLVALEQDNPDFVKAHVK